MKNLIIHKLNTPLIPSIKHSIKKLSALIILCAASLSVFANDVATTSDSQLKVREVEASFPYSTLIKKAESIKISYSETDKYIDCKVSILPKAQSQQMLTGDSAQVAIESKLRTAQKNHFKVAPLRACLTQNDARKLIASL
jgi:hypothetical protein